MKYSIRVIMTYEEILDWLVCILGTVDEVLQDYNEDLDFYCRLATLKLADELEKNGGAHWYYEKKEDWDCVRDKNLEMIHLNHNYTAVSMQACNLCDTESFIVENSYESFFDLIKFVIVYSTALTEIFENVENSKNYTTGAMVLVMEKYFKERGVIVRGEMPEELREIYNLKLNFEILYPSDWEDMLKE